MRWCLCFAWRWLTSAHCLTNEQAPPPAHIRVKTLIKQHIKTFLRFENVFCFSIPCSPVFLIVYLFFLFLAIKFMGFKKNFVLCSYSKNKTPMISHDFKKLCFMFSLYNIIKQKIKCFAHNFYIFLFFWLSKFCML